jgi:hypothetical protein
MLDANPTFLLGLAVALLGGIVWLVRLESKANTSLSDLNDLYHKMDSHTGDREIHHDGEELNRRFNDIGRELVEIKDAVKNGIGKLNDRFDRFLNK